MSPAPPTSSLSQASYHGDLASVAGLIAAGVDYLEADASGRTALHWAVANRHLEVVEILLDHHRRVGSSLPPIQVHTLTFSELKRLALRLRPAATPIELAAEVGDEAIFKLLLENLEPFQDHSILFNGLWPPLPCAGAGDHHLDEGIDQQWLARQDGSTPIKKEYANETDWWKDITSFILQLAIKDDKLPVVEMTLRVGADPEASYGHEALQPLYVAAWCRQNAAYIRLFLKYGANPNATVDGRQTILSVAIGSCNEQAISALLESGALVNAPSGSYCETHLGKLIDYTLFGFPVERPDDGTFSMRTLRLLLEAGADPNGSPQLLSIMLDSYRSDRSLFKVLVASGADLTAHIPSGPCLVSYLRNRGWCQTSLMEEFDDVLSLFLNAYGSPSSLRNTLLSEDGLRFDLLFEFGFEVDEPDPNHNDYRETLRGLGKGLLLGKLEVFFDSPHIPPGNPHTAHLVQPEVYSHFDNPIELTAARFDALLGILRVMDHIEWYHAQGGLLWATKMLATIIIGYKGGFPLEDAVEALLDLGADPHAIVEDSPTRLIDSLALSAIYGRESIISLLVRRQQLWAKGNNAFYDVLGRPTWFNLEEYLSLRSSYDSCVDTVMACLGNNGGLSNFGAEDIEVHLFRAIQGGRTDVVRKLMDLDIDVEKDGDWRSTPLCAAVEVGHRSIVDLLLEAQVLVNARIPKRPLAFPEFATSPDGTDLANGTALHVAAIRGDPYIVQKLLEHGADVHAITGTETCRIGEEKGQGVTVLDLVLCLYDFKEGDHDRNPYIFHSTEEERPGRLHPDRLAVASMLIEKGATVSRPVMRQWMSLKLDEVLDKFSGYPALWDMFVLGNWGES